MIFSHVCLWIDGNGSKTLFCVHITYKFIFRQESYTTVYSRLSTCPNLFRLFYISHFNNNNSRLNIKLEHQNNSILAVQLYLSASKKNIIFSAFYSIWKKEYCSTKCLALMRKSKYNSMTFIYQYYLWQTLMHFNTAMFY